MLGFLFALAVLFILHPYSWATHISGYLTNYHHSEIRGLDTLLERGKYGELLRSVERIIKNLSAYDEELVSKTS